MKIKINYLLSLLIGLIFILNPACVQSLAIGPLKTLNPFSSIFLQQREEPESSESEEKKKKKDGKENSISHIVTVPASICDETLGMYYIQASSSYEDSRVDGLTQVYTPQNAKLASKAFGWRPKTDSNTEWIQTDLGENRIVTRIMMQGCKVEPYWVKKYRIQYSTDMEMFHDYEDPLSDTNILIANKNKDKVSNSTIYGKFSARWVRILPMEWEGHICLKFQVFGCHDYRGPQGDRGIPGQQGERGAQGKQGIPGPKGDQGPKGDRGENGAQGIRGAPGAKGDTGEKGRDGARGEKGDPGDKGDRGDPGIKGETGEKGDRGQPGQRGPPGPQGFQGRPGKDGTKGDKGEKGDRGEKGERGLDGRNGADGQRGDNGAPGKDGAQGPPGADGPKGDTGPSGVEGKDGVDGQQGVQGPPGPENIENTKKIQDLEGKVKEIANMLHIPEPVVNNPNTLQSNVVSGNVPASVNDNGAGNTSNSSNASRQEKINAVQEQIEKVKGILNNYNMSGDTQGNVEVQTSETEQEQQEQQQEQKQEPEMSQEEKDNQNKKMGIPADNPDAVFQDELKKGEEMKKEEEEELKKKREEEIKKEEIEKTAEAEQEVDASSSAAQTTNF